VARLSLRGLAKRYGTVNAVRDVSLDAADGEFLVLLGPSGSGKSTILKLIAGIEAADGGEIWIGNGRVDTLAPGYRDVAMVFQSYALYPHMTVAANLAFPLRSLRVSREETHRRVAEVSALLELDGLLDRRPRQLSGGQQQRVALGRAIIRRPRVFLLDEPLSSLDAKLRARTRIEVTRLHTRVGATTVYVTHDQVEAMTMGDRVAVLDDGVVRQIDTPEVVYEYPADLVVADFLGSPPMNVMPVEARRDGDGTRFRADGIDLVVPGPLTPLPDRSALGIRAEYLRITTPGENGPMMKAVVDEVELLGSDRLVWATVGSSRVALRVPARHRVSPGESIAIAVDPAGIRLFDAESGQLMAGGKSLSPQ
jgi:multiple sugar transport system ATP-binding protein